MTEPAIDKVQGTGAIDANGTDANISHANGADANGTDANGHVIDLRETPTTRVRVSRDSNPFAALSPAERMKLIIRVLCEIVAYGEIDEEPAKADQPDHPAVTN